MRESLRLPRPTRDSVVAVALSALLLVELAVHGLAGGLAVPGALLAGLGLSLRRRLPVVGFLLCVGAMVILETVPEDLGDKSAGFLLIFFLALYSVGRWSTGRELWAGAVCVLAAMILFALGDASEQGLSASQIDPGSVAFTVVFVGGPWAGGLAIQLRKERERRLDAENLRLRVEQEELALRAVAQERARIARELHDVVSHAISVTVLQARGARRILGPGEAEVRRALDAIEHTNTQALGDMRRLLAVLRDTENDTTTTPQPSLARLDVLLEDVRRSGLPVDLATTGDSRYVPPGVDLSAYRIVQEALTNVLKHAGPATASVRLDFGSDALDVSVTDTGRGSSTANGRGHGLIGIRERVAVVGGEVHAGDLDDGGFEVRARLPYSTEVS